MVSKTVENYLKQLFIEQQRAGKGRSVPTGRLAELMGVTPASSTTMVKSLSVDGLVGYEPREGVRLSPKGRDVAVRVLRRHRLLELFLVKVVGMDWSAVHAEAEELEHAVSEPLLERIDALLGHPTVDPFGDAIPDARGRLPADASTPLGRLPLNVPAEVVRVGEQGAEFIRFVERTGLRPGAVVTIESDDRQADAVVVNVRGGGRVTLSRPAADKFFVKSVG